MKDVLLKSFNSVIEAEFAKNLLGEFGIKAVVQKQKREWLGIVVGGGDVGGTDLFVLEKDVERAREILKNKDEEKINI